MQAFVEGNIAFLHQARGLIEELSDAQYRNNDLPPFYSGVGQHVRHILDFYGAFLSRPANRIDYDRRSREAVIETDRSAAVQRIEAVGASLAGLEHPDATVWSKNDEAGDMPADLGFRRSTIGRELHFLASHTVHHFAIIAILLHHQGIRLPKDFGVAPSTLAHWRSDGKETLS